MRNLKEMQVLTQKGPACGTTSLAMILRFLTPDKSINPQDIDKEIRKLPWMFSSPVDLIRYTHSKGLRAEEYNQSSLQLIEDLVTQGISVIPLLDLTPDNALDFNQWHWVVIVSVEIADGHKILVINNPWGRQEEWELEKFSKEWACLRLLGLAFGYSNYFIAISTGDDILPECRGEGVGTANATTKGLADVLNGYATVRRSSILQGLGQIFSGVFRLFRGFELTLVSVSQSPLSGSHCAVNRYMIGHS